MRHMTIMLAALAILASGSPVHAHALLRRAQPAVGAVVKAAPAELLLVFSEAVEPGFSSVIVTDPQGERVDTGAVHTDPADGTHLIVGLRKLAPGTYHVAWHATSVDTHKTEGAYQFTVQP